ncbi:MAG TPA: asparagine synthase-related protein, partial [Thermoanaerobaculia bacterium]|nr:asparagine synthase-related protein [Thermoanaerobaculia bacterium]
AQWQRARAQVLPARGLPAARDLAAALDDPLLRVITPALDALAEHHGAALRHPLLDHRLFELAASLPAEQTAREGRRKRVLREAVRPWLPAAVVDQGEKIVPVEVLDRGLREREPARVWPLLTGMRAAEAGFVDEERLRRAYRRYLAGDGGYRFWNTVTLEDWLRHHF